MLGCAPGEDASGLFSEVSAVVGGLAHYEAMPELYAGLRVDFEDEGLYYDPAAGAELVGVLFRAAPYRTAGRCR